MDTLSPKTFFELEKFAHQELFQECSYVWDALKRIKGYLQKCELGRIDTDIPDGVILVNRETISIGKGTSIEPGAYIEGPCIIGEQCHIRHGAYLRGDVIVGDRSVVGHATEIKHSILLDGAKAPHFNYVGDSILGNNTNLGAGFVCSNFRFDGEVIKIYFNGEKIESGVKKFGLILGDGSNLGCNGVSNPGTVMGKGSSSYPCAFFGGVFGPASVVRPNRRTK